ncbi:immunity 49 family protein [Nocardia yamanashiensis]|uniref:immunity 49 family protein n=1 Tax=Nocardia yamanashiensis TaxID=209247 RepID=UPI000835A057|nr:immunity 49 family protein [Nocardia yamanashiensis]
MTEVKRHPIEVTMFAGREREYRGYLAEHLPRLPERPDNLYYVHTLAKALLGVLLIEDPQAGTDATQRAARLTEQVATGQFWVSASYFENGAEPIELRFGDTVHRIPSGLDKSADTGGWLTAFWWSMIARDAASADMLAHYDVARLRNTGGVADEFQYEWVASLQQAHLSSPLEVADRVRAIETTSAIGAQQVVDNLIEPAVAVFLAIADSDQKRFDALLAQALKRHRKYFGAGKKRTSLDGFLSVPLLGLACWARDRGLQVDVESEYIPKGFIENPNWMRTLDTVAS